MTTPLVWDQTGERKYETGVDRGVLFPFDSANNQYGTGVAWNGLTGVTETPSGAEETKLYADNIKYISLRSAEEFGGTIEAYTYPDEWEACDGSASLATGVRIGLQPRSMFGLSYRTIVGNDVKGEAYGYKLHLVYGATVSPSEKAYATINDSPEAITFSWEFTTTPIEVGTINNVVYKPTSILTIDTTDLTQGLESTALANLEGMLYGTTENLYYAALDVTSENFADKKTSLYTKSGSTYSSAASATYSSSETYYYKVTGPMLPMPKTVYDLFSA